MGDLNCAQSFVLRNSSEALATRKLAKQSSLQRLPKFDLILPELTMIKWWKEVGFVMTLLVNVPATL